MAINSEYLSTEDLEAMSEEKLVATLSHRVKTSDKQLSEIYDIRREIIARKERQVEALQTAIQQLERFA